MWLATSPACAPPIPSATASSQPRSPIRRRLASPESFTTFLSERSATISASSLLLRMRPTSVSQAADTNVSMRCVPSIGVVIIWRLNSARDELRGTKSQEVAGSVDAVGPLRRQPRKVLFDHPGQSASEAPFDDPLRQPHRRDRGERLPTPIKHFAYANIGGKRLLDFEIYFGGAQRNPESAHCAL